MPDEIDPTDSSNGTDRTAPDHPNVDIDGPDEVNDGTDDRSELLRARRDRSTVDVDRRRLLQAAAATTTVVAASGYGAAGKQSTDWADKTLEEQLKTVRKATKAYRDLDAMDAAGYVSSPIPLFCSEGYHFDNLANWETPLDPLAPESLFYVLNDAGKLTLGGAEYILVTDLDEDGDAVDPEPNLFNDEDEPVDDDPLRGTTESDGWHVIEDPASGLVLWDLHVWVHEYNPDGVFSLPNDRYADLPGCVVLEV